VPRKRAGLIALARNVRQRGGNGVASRRAHRPADVIHGDTVAKGSMMKRESSPGRGLIFAASAIAGVLTGCAAPDSGPTPPQTQPSAAALTAGPAAGASPSHAAVPAWATGDRFVGSVDATETVAVQVHLAMRNADGAAAELAEISDPDSPRYGQYLSDDAFEARYAPTADDVAAVSAHLARSGLRVSQVPANRAFVAAEGPASAVEQAFGTKLGRFRTNGTIRRAPLGAVQLPDAIASHVSVVLGLSQQTYRARGVHVGGLRPGVFPPGPVVQKATTACSEYFGQIVDTTDPPYPGYAPLTNYVCGYHPANVRDGYGLSDAVRRGNDGRGQSIAIVDPYLSPTLLADAQTYFANNDPSYPLKASQFSERMAPGTPTPVDTGWYGEQSLDVEAVHAIAPGATIAYVGAQSAFDLDLVAAINLIVTDKLATIVSNSYGEPEGEGGVDFVAWHAIATQAGLKGVGLYFSSGDDGDEVANIGFPSADFPASLDVATAVGGTSLALDEADTRVFEVGWETGYSLLDTSLTPPDWNPPPPGIFRFGSGGGTSLVYAEPSWQKGVVPPAIANANGAPARSVPDVAMLGDPFTGYFVGETDPTTGIYGEEAFGGTSVACPLFASTMALAQQHAKKTFGFSAPLLYKRRSAALSDIAPLALPEAVALGTGDGVDVTTFAFSFDYPGLTIHSAPGWDDVTGLGVPKGASFLSALCK
jgi:subtilase family serine protease